MEKARDINQQLRAIKARHNLKPFMEVKWHKVTPAAEAFYQDTLDYFFAEPDLQLHALVLCNKNKWPINIYRTHDRQYYELYFQMLQAIFHPQAQYRIYLNTRDTHGATRVAKLRQHLDLSLSHKFPATPIERVQIVRSREIEILQLTDLLIGAIAYINRGLDKSASKRAVIKRFQEYSGSDLTHSSSSERSKIKLSILFPDDAHAETGKRSLQEGEQP